MGMYRTVHIRSAWYKETESVEVTKGVFRGKAAGETRERCAVYEGHVDAAKLAFDINMECNKYEKEGFRLLSVIPYSNGLHEAHKAAAFPWAYGYGYTGGVVLLFHKEEKGE